MDKKTNVTQALEHVKIRFNERIGGCQQELEEHLHQLRQAIMGGTDVEYEVVWLSSIHQELERHRDCLAFIDRLIETQGESV